MFITRMFSMILLIFASHELPSNEPSSAAPQDSRVVSLIFSHLAGDGARKVTIRFGPLLSPPISICSLQTGGDCSMKSQKYYFTPKYFLGSLQAVAPAAAGGGQRLRSSEEAATALHTQDRYSYSCSWLLHCGDVM